MKKAKTNQVKKKQTKKKSCCTECNLSLMLGYQNDPIFCAFLMEGMVISAMDVIVSLFLPLCLSYDMGYQ